MSSPPADSWLDEAADYACSDGAFAMALTVLAGLLIALVLVHR